MSKCKNLEIFQATTKTYSLTFKSNGVTVDITDTIVYFTVKEKMKDDDVDAVIKKDITNHTDPENGKTLIELTADDTDLPAKSYYYDMAYKDVDDNKVILVYGRLKICKPVTTRG